MSMNEEDRERTSMDSELDTPEDPLLRREEAAARREAAGIGGLRPDYENEEDLSASEAERPCTRAARASRRASRSPRTTRGGGHPRGEPLRAAGA